MRDVLITPTSGMDVEGCAALEAWAGRAGVLVHRGTVVVAEDVAEDMWKAASGGRFLVILI